jgi:hypothetical protein
MLPPFLARQSGSMTDFDRFFRNRPSKKLIAIMVQRRDAVTAEPASNAHLSRFPAPGSIRFASPDFLKSIAAASKAKDYCLRDLIAAFACSDLSQKR